MTELSTLSPGAQALKMRFLKFLKKLRSLFWLRKRFGNHESLVRLVSARGVSTKIAVRHVRVSASHLVTAVLLVTVSHMVTEARRGIAVHLAAAIVARRATWIADLTRIAIPVLLKIVVLERGSESLMASVLHVSRLVGIVLRARDHAKMDVSAPRAQLLLGELLASLAMKSVSRAHLVSNAHLLLMRRLLFLRL